MARHEQINYTTSKACSVLYKVLALPERQQLLAHQCSLTPECHHADPSYHLHIQSTMLFKYLFVTGLEVTFLCSSSRCSHVLYLFSPFPQVVSFLCLKDYSSETIIFNVYLLNILLLLDIPSQTSFETFLSLP